MKLIAIHLKEWDDYLFVHYNKSLRTKIHETKSFSMLPIQDNFSISTLNINRIYKVDYDEWYFNWSRDPIELDTIDARIWKYFHSCSCVVYWAPEEQPQKIKEPVRDEAREAARSDFLKKMRNIKGTEKDLTPTF